MSLISLFALPSGLKITACSQLEGRLCVSLLSTQSSSACPLCGTAATRIHSRYQRRLADLPCAGQPVCFQLSVRKFFCDESTCPRKIFPERLAPFVAPSARMTTRLFQLLQTLGLATGGRLGRRVTDRMGIQTTRHTLLRRIMALPTEPVGQITELGIDDFAFKRGRTYGTLLVDLQRHHILDMLPDRKAETAATWMRSHPGIRVVSRDRGGDYASVALTGAPQAVQCADRFHLLTKPSVRLLKVSSRAISPLIEPALIWSQERPRSLPCRAKDRRKRIPNTHRKVWRSEQSVWPTISKSWLCESRASRKRPSLFR